MCASEPEPEPEPAGWNQYVDEKRSHEVWQASCMQEDSEVRELRDNVEANGWVADQEILDMAWRHEDPGSDATSSVDTMRAMKPRRGAARHGTAMRSVAWRQSWQASIRVPGHPGGASRVKNRGEAKR